MCVFIHFRHSADDIVDDKFTRFPSCFSFASQRSQWKRLENVAFMFIRGSDSKATFRKPQASSASLKKQLIIRLKLEEEI